MFRLIKYILILTTIIGLILFFTPLNLYYSYLEKELRPIHLSKISGSLIKGQSESFKYMGFDLGKANWMVYPNSWNRLAVDLKLEGDDYDVKAQVNKNPHRLALKKLKGTVDWQVINKYLNFRKGEINGYFNLNFHEIAFSEGKPELIEGRMVTRDLRLVSPIKKDLGEIEIVFNTDNPSFIVGTVNSQSNVVNVSGAIYIHKNHRWEIKLNIIPMPGEYEVGYALEGIGDRRRGGGRTLNMAGFY